jgi:hypothetical protein
MKYTQEGLTELSNIAIALTAALTAETFVKNGLLSDQTPS